ncbi:MAG: hypothetical protein A3F14_06675 [Gammaproteobacteria bacterium RIFCSPHIGHO2_12_FULL_43_28]|nr:MAG: hypothetical protein A3F14_06675 [Gammaproteobacteria bacterium RIFCSPHIGHO2_12_FULL_43_28]
METNVNYSIVGAFVIVLTAAIVVAIIWLSAGLSFEGYTTYKIYMEESVSGLSTDSPVEYNGVNVGTVDSIDIEEKNPRLVVLLLRIKSSTPITKGTVAMLSTRGITGVSFIALKEECKNLAPLIVEPGEKYPVIKTIPSIYVRIDTAMTQFIANFQKISDSFGSLLDKENLQAIKASLANLEEVTGILATNNAKLNAIIKNWETASKRFSPLLQSGQNTMNAIEMQTLPAMQQLLRSLDSVSRTLNEVALEIKDNPSVLMRGVDRSALRGPGEAR